METKFRAELKMKIKSSEYTLTLTSREAENLRVICKGVSEGTKIEWPFLQRFAEDVLTKLEEIHFSIAFEDL